VFGCGHRDWARAFLRVFMYLDQIRQKRSGTRLAALGTNDVADGKVLSDFSAWDEYVLWPASREIRFRSCKDSTRGSGARTASQHLCSQNVGRARMVSLTASCPSRYLDASLDAYSKTMARLAVQLAWELSAAENETH
jgi:hypothetical protein